MGSFHALCQKKKVGEQVQARTPHINNPMEQVGFWAVCELKVSWINKILNLSIRSVIRIVTTLTYNTSMMQNTQIFRCEKNQNWLYRFQEQHDAAIQIRKGPKFKV